MTNTKFGLNMTDDDKHLNPNWTVGTSANDSHEHTGDKLDEMKLEMIALKAQVQVLQTENKQLVEEKKIQEDKYSKLEKEMREKLLKRKLQESQDEFTEQKFRSLEENHLKEITELKVKNQKLTEDFDEKIKKLEEMNQQKISETCNEIMVSIREFSQLPLENWHDLLAFVPRNQLGNVVSEIGDRQFAYIIQSFLHDRVRKITLGQMEIIPPRRNLPNDQPVVKVWSNMAANMPDWPMPENIKSFVEINLNYVDMSVLPFLGKFKENSLLTDVNMCFNFGNFLRILDEDILLRVLIKIAPFITSIDSISSPEIDLFDVVYNNFYNKKSRLLLEEMLAKTRILLTNWCTDESECSWGGIMDNTCYWLYTPRDDEKPRMLKSYASIYESTNYYSFIERIKKDFEMANDPASFFIYVDIGENIEDISLENLKTSEKLVIKMKPNGNWKMLLISRYPLKAAKNWIEANEKEISEWITSTYLDRRIYMDDELTIAIMTNDNNSINSNWNVGTSANGGYENNGDELNEMKKEMIAMKTKMQVLEVGNKQLVETNKQLVEEKKIQDDKLKKLEKELREKSLKRKLQESQDEFAEQKFRSLEENHQKEIAELKVKNQKLAKEFEEKIKKLEEMIQTNQHKIGETENETLVQIHEMKVQLPLENWHDLLAFVPRSQLGNVVSEIGDRQFAYIIQSFLHDPVREITLGKMRIIPPRRDVPTDQPVVHVWPNAATNMPEWPMPGNIKDFKEIDLNYVDTSVLHFLGKFQQNSLLADVNLLFRYNVVENNILLQVLAQIVPLISSIESIQITSVFGLNMFKMVYCNNYNKRGNSTDDTQLLLKEMMAKTRISLINWHNYVCICECSWEDKMDWCCSWLYTLRNDGKPRMLICYDKFNETTNERASFIERIKNDFKMANNPASFFIYTRIHMMDVKYFEDISFENLKTNEKLVIKTKSEDDAVWKTSLLILRQPLNASKNWIEANEKEIKWDYVPEKLNRTFYMDGELKIAL